MRESKFPADMHNPIYNWISSFRGVAMTRFWDGRIDRRTDGQTDGQKDGRTEGRSDCIPRPAFAFGDAGKK